jgi:hypothetical protein
MGGAYAVLFSPRDKKNKMQFRATATTMGQLAHPR